MSSCFLSVWSLGRDRQSTYRGVNVIILFARVFSSELSGCSLCQCTETWIVAVFTSSCCSYCRPCRHLPRAQVLCLIVFSTHSVSVFSVCSASRVLFKRAIRSKPCIHWQLVRKNSSEWRFEVSNCIYLFSQTLIGLIHHIQDESELAGLMDWVEDLY